MILNKADSKINIDKNTKASKKHLNDPLCIIPADNNHIIASVVPHVYHFHAILLGKSQ